MALSKYDNFRTAFKELVNGNEEQDEDKTVTYVVNRTPQTSSDNPNEEWNSPEEDISAPLETTVIAKGTIINGSITSEGNVDVKGQINGDVECFNMRVSGQVAGNIKCNSADLDACIVKGNASVKNKLLIQTGSVLIGNISAKDVESNGRVKGNITVQGPISLMEEAAVLGDISAKSLDVDSGAVIQGQIRVQSDDQRLNFDDV